MNTQQLMKQHLDNISRVAGHPVSKYEYIQSKDDLTKAWVEAHNDLGYPLKKQSARDRFLIYNSKGLEQEINKIITELIVSSEKILIKMLKEDTTYAVQDVLDSINVVNNRLVVGNPKLHASSSFSSRVGKFLGKAIGQAAGKIVDLMTKDYK